MPDQHDLRRTLHRIDGKGYKAYQDLRGRYDFDDFTLYIDHVQGDPFATPSKLRVRLRHDLPEWTFANRSREIALRDFLTRQFARAARRHAKGNRGSGKSGAVFIDAPGQEILERTSVLLYGDELEARFRVGLPAFGRRIAGRQAEAILLEEIPDIVADSLRRDALDEERLRDHLLTNEDADALRRQLPALGLIAFVADGAVLPRASGVDPRPLTGGIPFQSPEPLRVEVELPNRRLTGLGIPPGITLIVGGGYHGKSTLLQALQAGIYNHLPGDGRAFVVTDPEAVKIRAEDGRFVGDVDISPFINQLPYNKDTTRFFTPNASGSTSQAANIIEALEAGARVLLMDEDTSATNFMIRDHLMQQLVAKEREPITPFLDKARQLCEEKGVSTILVVGGSGLYFEIADLVICMIEYQPHDYTERARAIAEAHRTERQTEGGASFGAETPRFPKPTVLDARRGHRERVRARGTDRIEFGTSDLDLSALEQIVDPSQLNAVADALRALRPYLDGRSLREAANAVMNDIEKGSLDVLSEHREGNYAAFRRHELMAAFSRIRHSDE